jgi:hypothetical protein
MHLVYYVYFVFTLLWRKTHLVGKLTYIIYRVIAGGIQFKDVEGGIAAERLAVIAHAACFHVGGGVLAVYGFGKYTRTSGFTHSPRTTKQVGMRQVLLAYGILQCGGYMLLPHNRIKRLRAVFPCRNYVLTHLFSKINA